jgi:hypothetical protein
MARMISRRELDSLEARVRTAPRDGPDSLRQRRLKRAVAAGASGIWTWDDARLVMLERAEEWKSYIPTRVRIFRNGRENGFTGPACPFSWAAMIVSYRPDEDVAPEYGQQLLELANSPKGWIVTLPDDGPSLNGDDVAQAVMYMLALETPDALRLRREIWTPPPAP